MKEDKGWGDTKGGVGNITKNRKDTIQYRATSLSDLRVVFDHFDKYPLITQK